MNDSYAHVGKPLTRDIARELIIELFEGQTVQRYKIIKRVDEEHLARGGHPRTARTYPVGWALTKMERSGLVHNPKKGIWVIHLKKIDTENSEVADAPVELPVVPEKTVGSGKGSVYLYYYPSYQRVAELERRKVWPCKIGMTRYDPVRRIMAQTRTALPEEPKIGLVIKTDRPRLMEKAIQSILELQGKQKRDAPGTEWFITSPSEVEQLYENTFGNSQ